MSERKEIPKKYREPRTEEERELVEQFKAAGIELLIEDAEPGEHRVMFFGPVLGGATERQNSDERAQPQRTDEES